MAVNISDLCLGLSTVNAEASKLCFGLSEENLLWRPSKDKWSIAENLIHLQTTTQVFLPAVDAAIQETRNRGLRATEAFHLGRYGRLLVWYVEPPPVIRLPAPTPLRPKLHGATDTLAAFLVSQSAMMKRMSAAQDLNLTGPRFPSPLASFVKMNLLEFFSVFNGHSRRHLWQANNVRKALDQRSRAVE